MHSATTSFFFINTKNKINYKKIETLRSSHKISDFLSVTISNSCIKLGGGGAVLQGALQTRDSILALKGKLF